MNVTHPIGKNLSKQACLLNIAVDGIGLRPVRFSFTLHFYIHSISTSASDIVVPRVLLHKF